MSPDWRAVVSGRLTRSGGVGRDVQDAVDELAEHVERVYVAAFAQGLDDAATAAAIRELDGLESSPLRRTQTTRVWWRAAGRAMAQDLAYGWRSLRARPGFTSAALLTLALGIGANTAMFTVVHAVLIRDLPYPDPARLVQVYESHRRFDFDHGVVNPANLDRWQRNTTAFTHLAPMQMTTATMTGVGDATRVSAPRVAPEFLDVMGVAPHEGRVFTTEEAAAETRGR